MRRKCTLKHFCDTMNSQRDPDHDVKGIGTWNFINTQTGKVIGSLLGYKQNAKERGLLLNYCPWCGFDYRLKNILKTQPKRKWKRRQK